MHTGKVRPRRPAVAVPSAWWCRALAALVVAAATPALAQSAREGTASRPVIGQPIRILPLGDSITQGGRTDRPEYTYRYPLYYMLKDAGYSVDFVGSMNSGLQPDAVWPSRNGVAFDYDHEGHYGIATAQARQRLPEWMKKYPVASDMALIHLGTNDYDAGNHEQTIIAPMKEIIALLRQQNPNIIILVGHLLEEGGKPPAVRPLIERMVRDTNTPRSPLVAVELYDGWVAMPGPDSDTFDWAHPNPKGQQKMADKWFAAIVPFLAGMRRE